MSQGEFEKFLTKHYKNLGYKVEETLGRYDYGADRKIEKDGVRKAVNTKNHSKKISPKIVRDVIASKKY